MGTLTINLPYSIQDFDLTVILLSITSSQGFSSWNSKTKCCTFTCDFTITYLNATKVSFLKSKTKKKPKEDATEVPEMISNYLSTTILNHIFQNHDIQVHSGSFYEILRLWFWQVMSHLMSHLEPISTDKLPVFRSNQEKVGQNVNKRRITRVPYLPVGKRIQLTGKEIQKFSEILIKRQKVASRIIIKKNNKWHLSVFMAKIET